MNARHPCSLPTLNQNITHRHYLHSTRTRTTAAAGRMSRPERQNTPQNYYNPKVRGDLWVGEEVIGL